jgi:hypothetical protein
MSEKTEKSEKSGTRLVIQQCTKAKLLIDNKEEYVSMDNGIIIFV